MSLKNALEQIRQVQLVLEDSYRLKTGLDVRDFLRTEENFDQLGKLHVVQSPSKSDDLDLALILDRDILSAFTSSHDGDASARHRATSVIFEEISHFVYLSFNHNRGRNVTQLEMEIQSEVDRIVLAFESLTRTPEPVQKSLWSELLDKEYNTEKYEESRKAALRFLRSLNSDGPKAWSRKEKENLVRFFHSDLSEKLFLSKK